MAEFKYLDKEGVKVIVNKIKDLTQVVNDNATADAELAAEVDKLKLKTIVDVAYVKGASSNVPYIIFKNLNDQVVAQIDATPFVKDGMLESATMEGNELVLTFNTDSEKEEVRVDISNLFNAENYYTKAETDEQFVKWGNHEGHKIIYLNESDAISGFMHDGLGANMLQMRKYASVDKDIVEVGSTQTYLTLNSFGGYIGIDGGEKKEVVATKSDIENATEDVVRYTPFENRKTIALAEGDTVSSMGINFGMVKTYEGLNYPEESNLNGLMPVLEVGGQKGALVLNTCESVVKVEVVEGGKRIQHAVATDSDIEAVRAEMPTLVPFTEEEINALFD